MVLMGFLLSFVFHVVGYHCNTQLELVKVSSLDIITNIDVAFISNPSHVIKGDEITFCEAYPNKCGREHDCFYYARELPNGLYEYCNTSNSPVDCKYYLKEGVCYNCTSDEICFQSSMTFFICGQWNSICTGDAFPIQNASLIEKLNCDVSCAVPEYYKWDIDTGTLKCQNLDFCGSNSTYIQNTELDQKLKNADATLVYPLDVNENSYENFIKLSCNPQLNPELTVFGLPIFNYQVWILLAILWVGVIFLLKLGQQH